MRGIALCWLVLGTVAAGLARADDSPVATTPPATEATAKVDPSPGQPPQIRLELKVVEVSLTRMQQAKLDFAQFGLRSDAKPAKPGARKPLAFTGQQSLSRESAAAMLDKLSQQKAVLKVLAEPSLLTTDRRAVYFFASSTGVKGKKDAAARKLGAQVAATPTLLGENRIDLKLHVVATETAPLLSVALRGGTAPAYQTREMDTEIKMELGATTVCGGLVRTDARQVVDPKTRRRSNVQVESETLFLVTLELATPEASESEPLTATRTNSK